MSSNSESRPRRRVIDDISTVHFLTFSCDHRRQLLNQNRCKGIVIHFLEAVRAEFEGLCFGFVIMPEHVHALVRFLQEGQASLFKQEWKRRSSRALVAYFESARNPVLQHITAEDGTHRVWTPKQYDFNVCTQEKAWEKLRYMHNNPVKRQLAATPEDWAFSSARWYAHRQSVGVTLTHIDE